MKRWQFLSLATTLAAVAAYSGYWLQQRSQSQAAVAPAPSITKSIQQTIDVVGKQAENFALADAQGSTRELTEWQGKVVALNFWATWCPPCREEIPAFIELQDSYDEQGLQFIGIALQTADEIQEFIVEFNLNYPSLVGEQDVISLAKQLGNGIGALPYTVIIDRAGIIQFTHKGPLSKAEAEGVIVKLL